MIPLAYLDLPLVDHDPVQIVAFEVLRQPYAIETARLLTWEYAEQFINQVSPGTPVVFRWDEAQKNHVIYGYVFEVRPEIRQLQRTVEIVIVGMQHPMSWLNRIRSFPRMGPHNAVAEIIDDYRFAAHIAPGPVQDLPDQQDVSDWQYLADLARTLGYVLLSVSSEVVFAPIQGYWAQSYRRQTYGSTFRTAVSASANITTFSLSNSPILSIVKYTDSPFGTEMDFTQFTEASWTGSKALSILGALFPNIATARLLDPNDIFPLDAFDVTTDLDRSTWAVLQAKYVLTLDDYYVDLTLGGNGTLYPSRTDDTFDIASALNWRMSTMARPPKLVVTTQVRQSGLLSAHWEASRVSAPGTKEESWLIGL